MASDWSCTCAICHEQNYIVVKLFLLITGNKIRLFIIYYKCNISHV